MKSNLSALLAGVLFALGLIISEMVNPQRIIDFLDITGQWNPSLLFVMVGALIVVTIGYRLIWRRDKPLFENAFSIPTNTIIDKRLLIGACIFGAGWGLSGLCPGPAIVALASFNIEIIVFMLALIIGMKGFDFLSLK